MVILHIGRIGSNLMDGLNVVVPALVAGQNALSDTRAALLVSEGPGPDLQSPDVPVYHFANGGLDGLPAPFDRPDIALIHDTYIMVHRAISRQLGRRGVPYILVPHGGMTRWAQSIKPMKKRAANVIFFNGLVRDARAIHCLTANEKTESLMTWQKPMFVLGNGTEIPPECEVAAPGTREHLRFVFIGRLDPNHKGLDLIVEACGLLHGLLTETGTQIKLHGPDYRGGEQRISARIASLGVGDVVELCGPVQGRAKSEVLKGADLFLHASRSEGHPLAVLEALARGVPCLLTPGTNVSEAVAAAGAGWEAQSSAASIAATMRHILTHRTELPATGQRAREYAVAHCSWPAVAAATVAAYERVLGQGVGQ